MDRYALSQNYFEVTDGQNREKVLGLKFLEIETMPKNKMLLECKDIADMSLMLCGFFSSSIENKIVSEKYYYDIGVNAYSKLNVLKPLHLDIHNFYKEFSLYFFQATELMSIVSEEFEENSEFMNQNQYLVKAG